MLLNILKFANKFKFWILLLILVIVVVSMRYYYKKSILELESIVSMFGVDYQTCKGNLALCETQFKNLSAQCRLKCPDMAGDINKIQNDYESSKKDLLQKQKEIKGLIQDIEKIREEKVEAGKIVWAENPTAVVNQLQNMLGSKWAEVIAKVKKDSGITKIETTGGHIAEVAHRFRFYPKGKIGVGYNFNEFQANLGVSLFSYGKLKTIDSSVLDFVKLYAGIGMEKKTAKFGLVPISLNLGSFVPLIRDLDLDVGYQIDTNVNRTVMIGLSSTF